MTYMRFFAMIAVAIVVTFGLMYLNSYALDHVFYSQTRAWMALVMGAVMSLLMLGFMGNMYRGAGRKLTVVAGALVVLRVHSGRSEASKLSTTSPT